MLKRLQYQYIKERIEEPRKFIQVLFGPRQVGKTTLMLQITEELSMPYMFVSADAVEAQNLWLEQQWQIARLKLSESPERGFLIIIDEIQKISNWSETVKALWDNDTREKRNLKVVVLGSSRLMLQQGLTESLAGRFETTYLGHWSFKEMQDAFGWTPEQFAWYGGYPGPADLISDEGRWKRYIKDALIETSISKDILLLTRIDKPALMRRLFELGCLYSGQLLSFNKILGQLMDAGNTTTLSHYLELLHTAGLLAGLQKFGTQLKTKASSPKFMVHNTALFSAQHHLELRQARFQPDLWGRVVESAVGAHLLNYAVSGDFNLFYWNQGNAEVDFILEKGGQVIALEVKSSKSYPNKGMEIFKKQFGPDKVFLVGGDDAGLPWWEFLKINPKELF